MKLGKFIIINVLNLHKLSEIHSIMQDNQLLDAETKFKEKCYSALFFEAYACS